MHNGVFKSLKEVVHFYNTRDVEVWPEPEVGVNVNEDELGNLGLTEEEEDAIVAFMKTLSDGYKINKMGMDANDLTYKEQSTELRIEGPNPFNPSTRLSYIIPEDGHIQLYVFNIIGQKVATLQEGFMSAGTHQVEFNGNHLTSGIYIATLHIKSDVKSVKLMLLK